MNFKKIRTCIKQGISPYCCMETASKNLIASGILLSFDLHSTKSILFLAKSSYQ